jgi:hypothetical protein
MCQSLRSIIVFSRKINFMQFPWSEEAVDEVAGIPAAATAVNNLQTPTSVQEQQSSQERLGEMAQEFVRAASDLSSRATVTGGISPQNATVIGNKELGVMTQELVQKALHLSSTAMSSGSISQEDGAKIISALEGQAAMIEDLKARVQQVEANFQDSLHDLGLVRTAQGEITGLAAGADPAMVEAHRRFLEDKQRMLKTKQQLQDIKDKDSHEYKALKTEQQRQFELFRHSFVQVYGKANQENLDRLNQLIDTVKQLTKKTKDNQEALEIIKGAFKSESDIDFREAKILNDPNPNGADYITTFQTTLMTLYNGGLMTVNGANVDNAILSPAKNLFPWEPEEATSLDGIKENAGELMAAGASMVGAVFDSLPFVAIASKLLQACYNTHKARTQKMRPCCKYYLSM